MDLESYRELREFKDKEVKGVNEGRGIGYARELRELGGLRK